MTSPLSMVINTMSYGEFVGKKNWKFQDERYQKDWVVGQDLRNLDDEWSMMDDEN